MNLFEVSSVCVHHFQRNLSFKSTEHKKNPTIKKRHKEQAIMSLSLKLDRRSGVYTSDPKVSQPFFTLYCPPLFPYITFLLEYVMCSTIKHD